MPSPAPALAKLKKQFLALYPKMKAADLGIMADAAHIAAGTSDHIGGNALDVPVAGGPGFDKMKAIVDILLKDGRTHYVIWNRVFYHPGKAPAAYHGASPHTDHIHLSIVPAKRADATAWKLAPSALATPPAPAPAPKTMMVKVHCHMLAKPRLDAKVVKTLEAGMMVGVTGPSVRGTANKNLVFIPCTRASLTGYVRADYLS